MNLTDLFKIFGQNKKTFLITGIIGTLFGVGLFYTPKRHIVSSNYYISRVVDTRPKEYYSYGGFYEQQTASKAAVEFISIAKTDNVIKEALNNTNLKNNPKNTRKIKHTVKIRKISDQVISIKAKSFSKEEAVKLFEAYEKAALSKMNAVAQVTDRLIVTIPLTENPVIKKEVINLEYSILGSIIIFESLVFSYLVLFPKKKKRLRAKRK